MVGDIFSGEVVTNSSFLSISNDSSQFVDFLFLSFLQNQHLGKWIRQCSPESEFFLHFSTISLIGSDGGFGEGLGLAEAGLAGEWLCVAGQD